MLQLVSTQSTALISRYLIISDLHLGHTLRSQGDRLTARTPLAFSKLRTVVKMDRAISRFVDTILNSRLHDPSKCMLVLNGDIFDFLHVDVQPVTGTFKAPPIDGSEESLYGLSFEESRSRWKLALIESLHRRVFDAFARFIKAGGRLTFVVGNHDVDLCFPSLQQDLRDYILRRIPEECHIGLIDSIQIEPWFYLSSPYVYMEHGHRFDPYTTFPDPLEPTSLLERAQLAPNFAHYGLRYFANRVPSFPIYDFEQAPWTNIYRWIRARGLRAAFTALLAAFHFFFKYWTAMLIERRAWSGNQGVNRYARRNKLAQIAKDLGWTPRRIYLLDAMKAAPVGDSPSVFVQALQLDRIAIVVSLSLFWVALAVSDHHARFSFAVVLGLSALGLWWFLDRSRPHAELHPQLGGIAQEVGRVVRVPIVVFGHTHQATCESHGRVIWLNPGSWEHLAHGQAHDSNADGARVHFGEITTTEQGVCAELRWYNVIDQAQGLSKRRMATFRDVS
jgi:UDP-2,3-diacylglucosamine pyrophosphatase LpxH